MTTLEERPLVAEEPPGPERHAEGLLAFVTSTDHKRIGISYMATAFAFYLLGGALAVVIRSELYEPGRQVVSQGRYNEMFTMHGSIMLFLFLGPFAFGLANYFVPLQIGARDMAFPRLNALSYWFYLFGGLTMVSGFLTADGGADFGWTGYTPLSDIVRSPGIGADLWIIGVALTGLSGILTGVNIVTTVVAMRAPGMRMFRMPIFTWNMLVTSVLVLIAFPILSAAAVMLFSDRHLGSHIYDATLHDRVAGAPILWQHLFWFFGHPEVYILVLPFFGVITEILPVFSWRPVFGYAGLVFATMSIAALSVGVWAHHMFATGAVLLPFFTGFSMLIAVPTGVKFFNWIGTMWGGRLTFPTPMLFALGFLFTFLLGGLSGVMLAAAPIDFHVTDSYFVVAHMHYVLFGGSVFALYAGIYYWWPKVTGRVLDERVGQGPLLDDARGLPPDVLRAAHPRARGHAPAGGRLPRQRRLHGAQPDLVDRRRSSWRRRRCRSCGTRCRRCGDGSARWRATTRGAGRRSNGRRPHRHRQRTSPGRCRPSGRSARRGTCGTPRTAARTPGV